MTVQTGPISLLNFKKLMIVQDLIDFLSNFNTEDVVIEGDNGVLQDIDRISYKMRENHMICTIVLVPKKE